MKIIEKDILTVSKGIICQSVNCQSKMGKGLALRIKNKWPIVYEEYAKLCRTVKPDFELLGNRQYVNVAPDLWVCNIFSQLYYGYNARFTDYAALKMAFSDMQEIKLQLYFPEKMGCSNGGGDWNIVSKMIDYYFPHSFICKLPQ